MRTVSISELKAHLSQYLHEVRRGSEVQILDRGVPVARLSGLVLAETRLNEPDSEHRQRLVSAGLLRPATAEVASFLDLPSLDFSVDLQGALDQERTDRV